MTTSVASEDARNFRRTKAQEFHQAAVFARVDLTIAEQLVADHPEVDWSDRVDRARTTLHEAEDLARRLAIHAGVVRAEFDAPVRQVILDDRLPWFRRQRAEVREMLDNLDLYAEEVRRDPRAGASREGYGTVEQATRYLWQVEAAIAALEDASAEPAGKKAKKLASVEDSTG